ncbi:MAG: hypothetical protein ACYSWQ_12530, partial [Planctomycetota bacterium]
LDAWHQWSGAGDLVSHEADGGGRFCHLIMTADPQAISCICVRYFLCFSQIAGIAVCTVHLNV